MTDHPSAARWRILIIAFALAISMALLVASLFLCSISFDALRATADAYAQDGSAGFVTPGLRTAIIACLLILSALSFACCAMLFRFREWTDSRLAPYAQSVATSPIHFARDLRNAATQYLRETDKCHISALGFIVIFGTALRLHYYFNLPIRNDEAHTFVHYALRPLWELLRDTIYPNNHLFHSVLAHFSASLFGNEVWALRLPSLVAGILVMPAAYFVTRFLYSKKVALLGTALVASSSFLIEYSSVARGYSILTLLFLVALLLAKYVANNDNPFAVLLLVLVSALGFFTIPVMIFPFGSILIWQFTSAFAARDSASRRRIIRHAICGTALAAIVTLLLYAPALHYSGLDSITKNRFITKYSYEELCPRLFSVAFETLQLWHRDIFVLLSVAIIPGFILALVLQPRSLDKGAGILLISVPLWIVPLLLIQRVAPFPRTWTAFLPLYLGIAAEGIVRVVKLISKFDTPRRRILFSLVACAITVFNGTCLLARGTIYDSTQDVWLAHAEETTLFLKSTLGPDDKVIALYPSQRTLFYYAQKNGLPMSHFVVPKNIDHVYIVVNVRRRTLDEALHLYEREIYGPGFIKRVIIPDAPIKEFSTTRIYKLELREIE